MLGCQVSFGNAAVLGTRNGSIVIGDRTFINNAAVIYATHQVSIGDNCLIGDYAAIVDTTFHAVDEGGVPKTQPIAIGDNVWVGRNSIIMPGVAIGAHSVVGAGSVVTKSFPEKVVVAGNPARILRSVIASDNFRRV